MASKADQASRQLEEERQEQEQLEVRNERHFIMNLKQLKSFQILKSALTIFTSNTKFMFFMILSIIPFFAFMVYTEVKLQKAIAYVLHFLTERHTHNVQLLYVYDQNNTINVPESGDYYVDHPNIYDNKSKYETEFFSDLVQLCLFYLVLYPLFEIFSMIITIRMAAKAQAGDKKQATLKQILNQNFNNLKGFSITCLCVHLLSTLTLIGLLWIVTNHFTITRGFDIYGYGYFFNTLDLCLYVLSIAIHSLIFVALLYKYLDWGAFWNTGMVISVLEEETGIGALGMADYYCKHCKRTGFQLMLVFFAFGNVLRLPGLFAGLSDGSVSRVLVTAIIIGFFCLANLVKWIAFVLYFYDCKQQTLEKKADEEVGKP